MKMTKNTVLITGGTSGVGFEFIKQLSELDNTIIVAGRDLQKLERTKKVSPRFIQFKVM
jgi:uncharacterized oxidoreductase